MQQRSTTPAWRVISPVLFCYIANQAVADVLPDRDNGPLTGIFGFPLATEGSGMIGRGDSDWRASFVVASHDIDDTVCGEELRVDGETTQFALRYRYGVSDRLNVMIEVPYLWHQSGSLDSAIDSWHDFFGLPDGSRAGRERDQLEFHYAESQQPLIDFTDNSDGIGDIRVLAAWRLSESSRRRSALRFGIKIPTGSSSELLGSGGTDLSIGLATDVTGLWGADKLGGFYRVNATYLGEPDPLSDRYNKWVGQLSAGLDYAIHGNVDLGVQGRLRSAVYDSEIESLGEMSAVLVFGADIRVSDRYRLVLSVAEDVRPDSAPDVSFQIALRYTRP